MPMAAGSHLTLAPGDGRLQRIDGIRPVGMDRGGPLEPRRIFRGQAAGIGIGEREGHMLGDQPAGFVVELLEGEEQHLETGRHRLHQILQAGGMLAST